MLGTALVFLYLLPVDLSAFNTSLTCIPVGPLGYVRTSDSSSLYIFSFSFLPISFFFSFFFLSYKANSVEFKGGEVGEREIGGPLSSFPSILHPPTLSCLASPHPPRRSPQE